MLDPGIAPYVIGVASVAVLGFVMRTFFAGLREYIVKAVVDSALKAILGEIQTGIKDVKEDMKLVKSAQLTVSQGELLRYQEMHAMRTRLEEHLDADEEFQRSERDFRLIVSEFMEWGRNFLKNHMHVGAVAEEPPPVPPMVGLDKSV